MSTLGNRIKSLRKTKKLTQKEFGDIFKLGESTISMYERDERKPDYEILQKIADYFEVTTDFLLGRSSESKLSAEEDKKITEETLYYLKILESLPDEERLIFEKKINDYAEYLRNKMD